MDHNSSKTDLEHGTYSSYIVGFIVSLVVTLAAYFLVVDRMLTGSSLVAAVIGLAALQLVVQLRFFLHVGKEATPRWNFFAFLITIVMLVALVWGSLWIMDNLNTRMIPVINVDTYKTP
jgi:cytochrome o ubiquinol oxidase subunit IV